MSRKKRTKYIGSWTETPFEKVQLPFTIESLLSFLQYGASTDSPYTHHQIADWSYRFWQEYNEGSLSESSDPKLSACAKIACDVDRQWELYLANTYGFKELQHMDFASIQLPHDWFKKWGSQLCKIVA